MSIWNEPLAVNNSDDVYPGEAFDMAVTYMRNALQLIGYPVDDHVHFADTPKRFLKALIAMNTPETWNFTTFDTVQRGDNGIVLIKDIPLASLCAHHLFPWFGTAHVAYIPKPGGQLSGLSKLARTIALYSAGPTVQEEVGSKSADFLMEQLDPMGAAVIIKAAHTCMSVRGAKAHGATTLTAALRGVFFDLPQARQELYQLLAI